MEQIFRGDCSVESLISGAVQRLTSRACAILEELGFRGEQGKGVEAAE